MKNMKIAYKIFLQSLIVILAFTLTIGWVYVHLKERLDNDKRDEIQHAVEATWGLSNISPNRKKPERSPGSRPSTWPRRRCARRDSPATTTSGSTTSLRGW